MVDPDEMVTIEAKFHDDILVLRCLSLKAKPLCSEHAGGFGIF
jgi:hypothetical protein